MATVFVFTTFLCLLFKIFSVKFTFCILYIICELRPLNLQITCCFIVTIFIVQVIYYLCHSSFYWNIIKRGTHFVGHLSCTV